DALNPGRGCHYKYLREHRLLLQLFPFDSKLPGLARAYSEGWVRGEFAKSLGVGPEDLRSMEIDLVAYKAWSRASLRYAIEIQNKRLHWFGKVFPDDKGESMLA